MIKFKSIYHVTLKATLSDEELSKLNLNFEEFAPLLDDLADVINKAVKDAVGNEYEIEVKENYAELTEEKGGDQI